MAEAKSLRETPMDELAGEMREKIEVLERRNTELLEEIRRVEGEKRYVESELFRLQKELKRMRSEMERLKSPPLIIGSIKDMLADGREYVDTAWWISVFPGLALMITAAAFNFFGNGVRDLTDPRLRNVV